MNNTKIALVTGASGGIGYACALRLAADGYDIAAHYNSSSDRAKQLCKEITSMGRKCLLFCADLTDSKKTDEMFEDIQICLGAPDVLCLCSGISQFALVTDITDSDWHKMIDVNLSSAFYCCRAAAKLMLSKKSGSIINISSVWGVHGAAMESHYSASKAALIGFTQSLAKELGPSGIRVNCIAPGAIDTAMNAHLDKDAIDDIISRTPLCRMGTPDDVAGAVSFLASPDSSFITGCTLPVTGGFY